MTEVDREALGRMVRDEWIRWAREQPDPQPSWLVPWDDLPEPDREVDRRIGQRLYDQALEQMRAHADDESLNPEALWRQVDRQWSARYRADVRSRDQAIAEAVADERQRLADAILPDHWQTMQLWGGVQRLACGRCRYGDGVRYLWPCPTRRAITGEAESEPNSALLATGSVPVATPDPQQLGTYLVDSYLSGREDGSEWALIDNAKPDDLRGNLQYALRLLAAGRSGPVATPTEPVPAEQLGDPYSLSDWIDQTCPVPALLEPVADAIGQAMTTRQGPPEIAARAMAAAAPIIGGMCHWVQNRGTARAETHQAFHYGSPCPYEAMATVLRGEPDPRDTAAPAGDGLHHPVAALCHSLWCEQPHVTLRRGRHGDCTISTPHWHPPGPGIAEQPVPASPDEPAAARPPEVKCWCGGNPTYPHTRGREGCRYAPGGDLAEPAASPAPGSLGYAQRIAEQRGDLADADDEDGME